jgi:hypothetical protein
LEKTEEKIKNGQSRDIGSIWNKTQSEYKKQTNKQNKQNKTSKQINKTKQSTTTIYGFRKKKVGEGKL